MEALAGTDQDPAVAGYDPDVGGELYTTNGEITDTMYLQEGILGYTIELDGGSGAAVGGTTTAGNAVGSNPGGFVFQDREADVAGRVRQEPAVHARPGEVRADARTSRPRTSARRSRTSSRRRSRRPTARRRPSRSTCARARRRDGQVADQGLARPSSRLHRPSSTAASATASPASTTTACAARSPASRPATGSRCGSRPAASARTPFTFTASRARPRQPGAGAVRRGLQRAVAEHGARHRPELPRDLHSRRSPTPASPPTSTTSTPAAATWRTCSACSATTRPSSGTRALDDYVRDPGQTVGVSKMFDDQMIAVRDYLNEGGKVLVTGQRALAGRVVAVLLQPARALPGQAAVPFEHERDRPPSASSRTACNVSNDFLQYWMGANARANAGDDRGRRERADDRRPGAVHGVVLADRPVVPAALHADLVGAAGGELPAVRVARRRTWSSARRTRSASRPTTRCCGASAWRTSPTARRARR